MNKKKIIKPLIAAAAAAAIAGVGAVSFAKWWAGNNNTVTTTGNATGAVSVLEFGTTTPGALSESKKLLPYDQLGTDADKITCQPVTFKVKESEGYAFDNFKLKVEIANIKHGNDEGAKTFTNGIYVGKAKPTTTAAATASAAKVDADGATVSYKHTEATDGTYTLYVWLVSDSTADMNLTFNLVYTLLDGEAPST